MSSYAPHVRLTKLPNGLALATAENPAHPSVVIRLAAVGGQSVEPLELAGLAHLANRALVHRCQRLTPDDIDRMSDEHGITLSRGNNRHASEITVRCPIGSFDVGLALVAELAQRPAYVDDEVRAIGRQLSRSVMQEARDPRGAAVAAFRRLAYAPDHPYARQPAGSAETLARIQARDVEAFHDAYIRPEHTVLTVAGDVHADRVHGQVVQAFGEWLRGSTPARAHAGVAPPAGHRESLWREHDGLAEVIVGGPSVGRADRGFRALQLGTLIFGQLGLSGRLGARLRERAGLAYECYAALEDAPADGLWTARASVRPEYVERTVDGMLAEMRRMRDEPVSVEELESSRAFCQGALALQFETNAGLASILQSMAIHDLGVDYLERFVAALRAVTAEDIQRECQRWLRVDEPLVVIATPRAAA